MPVVGIGVLPGVSSSKKIAPEASLGEQPQEGTALDQDQAGTEPHVVNDEPAQDSGIEKGRVAEALAQQGEGVVDKVVMLPQRGGSGDVAFEGWSGTPCNMMSAWHGNRTVWRALNYKQVEIREYCRRTYVR